jgi:hypothetical protein
MRDFKRAMNEPEDKTPTAAKTIESAPTEVKIEKPA